MSAQPIFSIRTRMQETRSNICPACLSHFKQKKPWQRFCASECKTSWEALFREISATIAEKVSAFHKEHVRSP